MPAGSDTALRARPRRPVAVSSAPAKVPALRETAERRVAVRLAWSLDARGGRRTLADLSYSDRTIRLVTAAPLGVLAAGVGAQLALTPVYNSGQRSVLLTFALMTLYMPMVGYLVWSAAHLRRPRGGEWMLAATAAIIAAGVFVVGNEWQLTFAHLLVSTLVVLPRPWSIVGGCLVVAAVVPVDLLVDPAPAPLWTMLVVVQRAGAVLVPTWFAGALRELRAVREDLASQAVLRERIRIDGELTRTVGDSLATIADRGEAIAVQAGADAESARGELRALVDGARRTLAVARRLIRAYQRVPLRTELETAMALLSAAGVSARLVLPDGALPRYADPRLRKALRAAVECLLHDESGRAHVVTLKACGDRLGLAVSTDGAAR